MARTVVARWRHARIFGLGDRAAPASFTPGLCLTQQDPEMGVEMAPFIVKHDSESLPASLTMKARGEWAFPFEQGDVPEFTANEGHTLPPSLQEANSGPVSYTHLTLPTKRIV